jgi:hypothetical protein
MSVQCAPTRLATLKSFSLSEVQSVVVGRGKEMESADDRFDRLVRKLLPREGENVHDAVWPQPVMTTSPSGVLRTSLSQVWVGGQSNGMQVIPTKVEQKAASNAAAEQHSVSAKAR